MEQDSQNEILAKLGAIVVSGDINAKAVEWDTPHPDSRGKYVMQIVARTDLLY